MRQFIGTFRGGISGQSPRHLYSYAMHYDGNELTITVADNGGYVIEQWARLFDDIPQGFDDATRVRLIYRLINDPDAA